MQWLDPPIAQAVEFIRAAYAVPEVKNVVDSFFFLSGTSGAFWIISKLFGHLALGIHDALDYSLAVLFAVAYNIVLAVLYSSVIASAVALTGKGGNLYIWYKIAGFICIYVMLKIVYADNAGKLDEYGLLGYIGGVASYIFFILKPDYLRHPLATRLYDVVYFVTQSGIGRVMTALTIVRALFGLAKIVTRTILASLHWIGARLDRKTVAAVPVFLL